jgi:hypothetical protein
MSRRAQENLVLGVVILVLLAALVISYGYGPRARMVPVPVAVFGLILALVQLVWQNLRSTDELQVDFLEVLTKQSEKEAAARADQAPDEGSPARPDARATRRRVVTAFVMVLAFLALVLLVGPLAAIFLFTAGYFVASGHYAWLKGLIYTSAFTAAIYLLFVVGLEIQLYHGVLEPLVERWR